MEVRLLGPLEVLDDHGQRVILRGRRAPAILALLALHPDQPVTTAQLAHALWGTRPLQEVRGSVHLFVHQLRKALGQATIQTQASSYLLHLAPEQLDVFRFQQLADTAGAAATRADHTTAWEGFTQALAVWRGTALADLDAPFVQQERARLEERRLTVTEERFRVGLALGWHAELAGELEALSAEQPLREGVWELLMLARYRTGRQAAALEAYQSARTHLAAQEREPGAGLQRLQQRILNQDPALRPPADRPAARPPAGPDSHGAPVTTRPSLADRQPDTTGSVVAPARVREERKTVTVLVIDLVGATGDPEDARAQLAGMTRRVEGLAGRYGGRVSAGAMGRLLAVFGARQSHEDDPERAVRAALELRGEVQGAAVPVRVGVATGEVVATLTDPGTPEADPAVGVVGQALDVATALATSTIPGSVLVTARVHRATSRVITYRPAPLVSMHDQGQDQAPAWEALAPRARTGAYKLTLGDAVTTPLVERARELGILTDVLARFRHTRQPQLLTVVSEPGLGKTRLVGELGGLVDRAPELITWRSGRSAAYGAGSLEALTEIVKAHAGILDTDPPEQAHDKLDQTVTDLIGDPDEAAWVTAQLRMLTGPTAAATAPTAPTRELVGGWVRFLAAAAARRPMVVVFEDLHWADGLLLEFVDSLIEQAGPVPLLVVGTARTELLDRHPRWGGGNPNSVTITLSPLSPQGTGQLLDALLGELEIGEAARTALLAAAGGNPLFVEEYARMLTQVQPGSAALVGAEDAVPVPDTIQQLIAARLDTLPPGDKRLLQDAAVIGEVGWVGALATISGQARVQVEAGLRRLERQQLLRRLRASSVAGETEYAFRHTLIRGVAYQQLLRADRAGRHQRAARWVEALTPDPDEHADLLAYHYGQALALTQAAGGSAGRLAEQTRLACRAAGDRAAALGALTAAARHYERALELWPQDDPAYPELLLQLGLARSWYQQHGGEQLTAARDAFIAAGDSGNAVRAHIQLARLARNSGDPLGAKRHLEHALEHRPIDPVATTIVNAAQVLELSIREEFAQAIELGREVTRNAELFGIAHEAASGFIGLGRTRLQTGDAGGLADLERGITLHEQGGDPETHFARWTLASSLIQLGDLRRAEAVGREGRRLAEAGGKAADAVVVRWYDAVLAVLDGAAGRWDDVLAVADQVVTGRTDEPGYPEPWYRPASGRVRLGRGDLGGALEDASAGMLVSEKLGETRAAQTARALQARVLVAAGHLTEARALTNGLLSDQRRDPRRAAVTPDEAVVLVELGIGTLPEGLWPTRWHEAVGAFVARDFARAAKRFARMGAHADEATASLYLARQLAAAGQPAPARAALETAVDFWRLAGASAYLREVEALAAELEARS